MMINKGQQHWSNFLNSFYLLIFTQANTCQMLSLNRYSQCIMYLLPVYQWLIMKLIIQILMYRVWRTCSCQLGKKKQLLSLIPWLATGRPNGPFLTWQEKKLQIIMTEAGFKVLFVVLHQNNNRKSIWEEYFISIL